MHRVKRRGAGLDLRVFTCPRASTKKALSRLLGLGPSDERPAIVVSGRGARRKPTNRSPGSRALKPWTFCGCRLPGILPRFPNLGSYFYLKGFVGLGPSPRQRCSKRSRYRDAPFEFRRTLVFHDRRAMFGGSTFGTPRTGVSTKWKASAALMFYRSREPKNRPRGAADGVFGA